ncbi:MAG: hypothetical protein Q8M06_11785 [Methanobacteriaceae archaeon]|jgi:hypothetical protein|nr:hypothetical protein [Methanobacteriaceae archaeon]MDZ4170590.1 hypothetical protein [Methanobacteriaceae archaeon]
MEIAGKDKSITIDELIEKLKQAKKEHGNIQVYYPYDGMNVSISKLEYNLERIEERGRQKEDGTWPKYLVPEHILING